MFWENNKKVDKMQVILWNHHQIKKNYINYSMDTNLSINQNTGVFLILIFSQIFIATLKKKRTIIFLLRNVQ